MRRNPRFLPLLAVLAVVVAVPGCAPSNTASTFSPGAVGAAAQVSYGTVVASRPVQIASSGGGSGGLGGAVAGGLVGSTIGGDWRARMLGGVGGALIGGVTGNAIGNSVGSGAATEFIVREERGGEIAVVQTNEDALQPGERVMITRGDRVRLSRAPAAPAVAPARQ